MPRFVPVLLVPKKCVVYCPVLPGIQCIVSFVKCLEKPFFFFVFLSIKYCRAGIPHVSAGVTVRKKKKPNL